MSTYHEKYLPKSAHKAPEIACFAWPKIRIAKSIKRPDYLTKFAFFNWTLFVLFISLFIRYHNTCEVATHKIRNTVTQGEGYDRKALQWNEEKRSGCIC